METGISYIAISESNPDVLERFSRLVIGPLLH